MKNRGRKKNKIKGRSLLFAALFVLFTAGCKEPETNAQVPPAIVVEDITPDVSESANAEIPDTETPEAENPNTESLTAENLNTEGLTAGDSNMEGLTAGDSNTEGPDVENPDADTVEKDSEAEDEPVEEGFYIKEIDDEIFARIEGKSYKADCTLPREDLRYIHVLHKNIEGDTREGELIVNVHIAEDVLDIFKELYDISYPIEKIRLIDEYDADDELSMEDNNTSSFNFRVVSGSGHLSKHALGMAIDINPLYNPYITASGTKVEPINAVDYADRSLDFEYKIDEEDEAYKVFKEHGFFWGGAWKNTKDYQHFEITTEKIREYYSWY